MAKILEIRWHGRGGQGAKTGSTLLGEAIVSMGRYVQAFPDYGPERMGAPMRAYNRISDEPITIHCGVTNPHVVLVLDETLLGKVDVTQGLPEDGTIIVNTNLTPAEIRSKLNLKGRKVFTVDANRISVETIGRSFPNTPMLGALVRTTGVVPIEELLESTRHRLTKKFRTKPEAVEGNIKAIERAYQEVRGE
ncbi:MAG: pyruvate synthase [Firmicutes bacterium]|nr:pyruvate synthase [Bacillota bacterium]